MFYPTPLPVTVNPARWRKEPDMPSWHPALRITQGTAGITLLLSEMDAFITECEAIENLFRPQQGDKP